MSVTGLSAGVVIDQRMVVTYFDDYLKTVTKDQKSNLIINKSLQENQRK